MKRMILPVCLMICLLAGSFAAWKLYGYYRIYRAGKKEYDKLTNYIDKNVFGLNGLSASIGYSNVFT